ncbi:hypothetical protein [Bacillus sp. FJAT-29937]|uniref:hypothetical protein n=1 Tax=Bacillus sp. FJAT-29937 TaxID=1720553 RepID=UPI00082F3214|nr:hypothetical protein [Bacillus sp. FJAT-29937]
MSIKELFNQNRNHEKINKKIDELEKNYLKINAIEVRLNRLFKLEEKIYSLQKVKEDWIKATKGIKSVNSPDKFEAVFESKMKAAEYITAEKLEKLSEKMSYLEAAVDKINQKIADQDRIQELTWRKLEEVQEKLQQNSKSPSEEPIVIREIHIDKFYLDKYEQNNNIAQVGIKELSGALNIGATFGKDTIPKEMNNQLREHFEEVIAIKKEKNGDSSPHQNEETNSFEEEEDFSEVLIEEEKNDE